MTFQNNYNQNTPFIPYNAANRDYARFNRKNPTKAEYIFWNSFLKKDKTWFRFVRQKTLWGFIADFYCSKLLLLIEIDGWYHTKTLEEDKDREIWMQEQWIKTVRFTNEEVLYHLDWVEITLQEIIAERKLELWL